MKFIASISAVIAGCAVTVTAHKPAWGYRAGDPRMVEASKWADSWESCGGLRQSPIDIVPTVEIREAIPLSFSGHCSLYNLTDPHEPLEVDAVAGNCAVSLNDDTYKLKQFHLHAPSEHTLNGSYMDAEIHFVHASSDGSALLVVGIFLKIGATSNTWLGPVLDALEQVSSNEESDAIVVKLKPYSRMVKRAVRGGAIYNYPGSLTTPGCDETVDWWVVENPVRISSIDFGRLHQDLVEFEMTDDGNNARPTQPLNGRAVARYFTKTDLGVGMSVESS